MLNKVKLVGNILSHCIADSTKSVKLSSRVKNLNSVIYKKDLSKLKKLDKAINQDTVNFSLTKNKVIQPIENFDSYKTRLISQLKKQNFSDNKTEELIKNSTNEIELNSVIKKITTKEFEYMEDLMKDKSLNLLGTQKKQKTTLAFEQYLNKVSQTKEKRIADLYKTISVKDTDPEIIKIKQQLQNEFGIKELYFDNHLDFAQNCLEVMKILKNKNLKLPDQIIGSRFFSHYGINLNSEGLNTILINTEKTISSGSTNHPLHIIMHEALHGLQPKFALFNMQKIPEQYRKVANNLSDYAYNNYAHEVHCELLAKKVLSNLSKEEDDLFNYLGGFWI